MLQLFDSAITQASLCYVLIPTVGLGVMAAIGWGVNWLVGEAE